MSTDEEWEKWGQKDPYFGVLTNEKFRSENLSDDAKKEFFQSGRDHVEHVMQVCRKHLDQHFLPKKVLDFGCGVGRLVVPFAQITEEVVGLDVSDSMLKEARKNCADHALTNVSLQKSDDTLSALTGKFDLIHTFIVMQHIPTERGREIFENLLSHLTPNGIGAIQVAYAKQLFKAHYGLPPVPPQPSKSKKIRLALKRILSSMTGSSRTPFVKHNVAESISIDPEMQMNSYHLNELFFLMQSAGIKNVFLEFTDHGGELGTFLYFQKTDQSK